MRKRFAFVTAVLLAPFVFDPAPGGATPSGVSTVEDAIGDSTHPAPYMDVLSAKVHQRKQGTLFLMELAGAIPDTPTDDSLIWVFHLDTDPNSSPQQPGLPALYVDYAPRVVWNGTDFIGQLLRRFTTTTGDFGFTITSVPFEIHGGTVRLTVDPALLGNPSSFDWNAATRPSTSVAYSDFAPGCLTCLVTWTAK